MQYSDGQEIKFGDKVRLGGDCQGVVVVSLDTGEHSDGYSKEAWSTLKKGVLIYFPTFGLIHYEVAEQDLELIERAK